MDGTKQIRAVAYLRCSTDETRQSVENQLGDLRRYTQAQGWECVEVAEYSSAYRDAQPKLKQLLELVRSKVLPNVN